VGLVAPFLGQPADGAEDAPGAPARDADFNLDVLAQYQIEVDGLS
jgi:hypothetical protein